MNRSWAKLRRTSQNLHDRICQCVCCAEQTPLTRQQNRKSISFRLFHLVTNSGDDPTKPRVYSDTVRTYSDGVHAACSAEKTSGRRSRRVTAPSVASSIARHHLGPMEVLSESQKEMSCWLALTPCLLMRAANSVWLLPAISMAFIKAATLAGTCFLFGMRARVAQGFLFMPTKNRVWPPSRSLVPC
jgi:hypothetical protein